MSDYLGDDELRERIISTTALIAERDRLAAWCNMASERIEVLREARARLRQTDDADDRGAYFRALDDVLALEGLSDEHAT